MHAAGPSAPVLVAPRPVFGTVHLGPEVLAVICLIRVLKPSAPTVVIGLWQKRQLGNFRWNIRTKRLQRRKVRNLRNWMVDWRRLGG